MRILCLIDSLGSGGAQRQIVGLTYFLKQNGYCVDLAFYHEPNFYSEWLNNKGIESIKCPLRKSRIGKVMLIRSLIKKNEYDTVIAYLGGPAIICCILKLLRLRFKLIVSERNVTQIMSLSERIKFEIYRWADVVIANSYTQTELIKTSFSFLNNKTHCITNFVDLDFFSPVKQSQIRGDKMVILVVGRINQQKNILNFLKALSIVKRKNLNLKIRWFGDYDSANDGVDYFNRVMELRDYLGLTGIIEFFSATTDIVNEYRNCDVFCLPSFFEGFPNVICEAMSCGKAILCSRVCDNPMIVEDGINGVLFDPCSPNDIAYSIERVYRMSSVEREAMGKKSRCYAELKFSPTVFVDKYIEQL